jgi:hypothetical protein
MIESRECLRFPFEPGATLGIERQIRREDFQGDRASQPGIVRSIDFAHAPGAEGALDRKWTQLTPRFQRHERQRHTHRDLAELSGLGVSREHRVHFLSQGTVIGADVIEIRRTGRYIACERSVEDLGDLPPASGVMGPFTAQFLQQPCARGLPIALGSRDGDPEGLARLFE